MQILRYRRAMRPLTGVAVLFGLVLLLMGQVALADTENRTKFDHALSGFPLTGAHERARCESCHANGIFKGTPNQCRFCHQSGSKTSNTSKPPNHVPTNAACEECHTSTSSWSGARFNHFSMGGVACVSCHNGSTVTGKPPRHVPSSSACESCHRGTATWSGADFDHAGVAAGCVSCHSGFFLGPDGPPASHIPGRTTNCEGCHRSTSVWLSF